MIDKLWIVGQRKFEMLDREQKHVGISFSGFYETWCGLTVTSRLPLLVLFNIMLSQIVMEC